MTPQEVYALARQAGLSAHASITATAVAMAESSLNPAAVGDVALVDSTWGPSIGLWQIRSLKADQGTGGTRDGNRLRDPAFNARSMARISNLGQSFGAWTTYKNGSYRAHLATVRQAVNGASSTGLTAPSTGVAPAWSPSIPNVPDDLTNLFGDAADAGTGLAGKIAEKVVGILVAEAGPAILIGIGVLGGFSLIAIGAWRGTQGDD